MKRLSLLLLVCGAFAVASYGQSNPVLKVEGGQIQGVPTATKGVTAYKGVPFAAPPVGKFRWREPQPVVAWQGIKIAEKEGPASHQNLWNPTSFYGKEWGAAAFNNFSEDCLYLNVYTPAAGQKGKKLPVAMWIHGGGYREGFAYEPEMDGGEEWATRGVILVQVTYRLGILGFFTHPLLSAESPNKVSGNYGVMDQAAALKWIYNNIEQFGGDPKNITIFGQSAGAGSVQTLLASPISRKYVAKAISMSGGGLAAAPAAPVATASGAPAAAPRMGGMMGGFGAAQSLDSIAAGNKRMMDYFKKTTLEDMRAVSFEELNKMSTEYSSAGRGRMGMMSPITDKYFLMGSFSDAARANEIPDIPYMFGYTANDMNDMSKAIADFAALRNEKSKQPVYAYIFSRQLPEKEGVKSPGAFHSSDLWYIFHSFRNSWRPFTKGDNALSLKMVDFWTNFAKYGNPNGKDAEIWTAFTKASPKFITLDVVEGDKASFVMTETPKFLGGGMPR